MKNTLPFFSISLAFMKPEISATFFPRQGGVFLGFLPDITQVNFLKLLFYFTSHAVVILDACRMCELP